MPVRTRSSTVWLFSLACNPVVLVNILRILYLVKMVWLNELNNMKISFGRLKLASLALCFVVLSIASAAFVPKGHSSPGIFKITLMVPGNANPARQSWSLVVQSELQNLGIDAGEYSLTSIRSLTESFSQPTRISSERHTTMVAGTPSS